MAGATKRKSTRAPTATSPQKTSAPPAPLKATANKSQHKSGTGIPSKRPKLDQTAPAALGVSIQDPRRRQITPGTLYLFGKNDCGQLGFECNQRKFPALVPELNDKKFIDIVAGGLHTIALDDSQRVWSWGLNDEGALGRITEEEEENFEPKLVPGLPKVLQIAAGDCHSMVLGVDEKVYIWGVFRGDNGNYGLFPDSPESDPVRTPRQLELPGGTKVKQIRSGNNHIAILTESGQVYTAGSDFSWLGRSYRNLRSSGSERVESLTLRPVVFGSKVYIDQIWTGGFSTVCRSDKGIYWVFGNNRTKMLGIENDPSIVRPTQSRAISSVKFKDISMGQFHCLGLTEDGQVYAWGQHSDGQLGVADLSEDSANPLRVNLPQRIKAITAGGNVSYAVTQTGQVYSSGFGVNWQLGNGEEDEQFLPSLVKFKITREGEDPIYISGVEHITANVTHTGLIGAFGLGTQANEP